MFCGVNRLDGFDDECMEGIISMSPSLAAAALRFLLELPAWLELAPWSVIYIIYIFIFERIIINYNYIYN